MITAVRLKDPQAPWLFEGAMDGELFLAGVKQELVGTLAPGDVAVLDNLATHKVPGVREAIEGAGAWLEYLPPYSPDFNPIERMWHKVKQRLKGLDPRNARQLHRAAGAAFDAVPPRRQPRFLFTRRLRSMIHGNALSYSTPSSFFPKFRGKLSEFIATLQSRAEVPARPTEVQRQRHQTKALRCRPVPRAPNCPCGWPESGRPLQAGL